MSSIQLFDITVLRQQHRTEMEQALFEAVYNPDWRGNKKLFVALKKALQLLPSQHGWYASSDETWEKFITNLILNLGIKGYQIISRRDFDIAIHYEGTDENAEKWLNTIHTDCRTDMRLMFDLVEVLETVGFIIPGEIENMTFIELAVLLSNIFVAMRSAGLGLIRTSHAKPPW